MGPIWVPASSPSPTLTPRASSPSISSIGAYICSGTYTRLIALQICPLFSIAPQKILGATAARSTYDNTIAASFPPSSRVTRFRSGAAAAATFLPVATEPVKEIFLGTGWLVIMAPNSSPPEITFITPGGPISRRISPSLSVVLKHVGGQIEACRVRAPHRGAHDLLARLVERLALLLGEHPGQPLGVL